MTFDYHLKSPGWVHARRSVEDEFERLEQGDRVRITEQQSGDEYEEGLYSRTLKYDTYIEDSDRHLLTEVSDDGVTYELRFFDDEQAMLHDRWADEYRPITRIVVLENKHLVSDAIYSWQADQKELDRIGNSIEKHDSRIRDLERFKAQVEQMIENQRQYEQNRKTSDDYKMDDDEVYD